MSRWTTLLPASCWAVGTWCAAGAVTALGNGSTGRIGVLPPVWLLVALLAAAWLAVIVGRISADTARPLYLPLFSVLPWLPFPMPAAGLLWVGPFGLALAVVSATGSAVLAWRARRGGAPVPPVSPAITVVALVALFALAAWRMAPVLPGGDEPHYLVITQSLLNDGDLRIEDNHRRREYAAYVNGELRPDYLRRGRDREIYSIHAPGVSALVLPAFAIGGYLGAVLWLCLLSAAGAVATWRAAQTLAGSAQAAWVATAGVVLSAPFFFQAFTIYPDGPAAVVVSVVVWLALVRRPLLDVRTAAACGMLLMVLPWLHTRYAAIAGPLGLVVLARIVWTPGFLRPLLAFVSPAALGGAAWLYYFATIYGVWDPRAPYGHATDMRWGRIPHGVAGLLFDQQYGLLVNAPVFLLAIPGMYSLWRISRRLTCELLLMTAPYVVTVAAFHMWWGGRSTPARFLVPVLLPLALPIAAWWSRNEDRGSRSPAVLLVGISLALTAGLVVFDRGVLAYNSRDGHALWLLAAARPVNLTLALPSLFQAGPAEALRLAAMWAGLGAAACVLVRQLDRRRWRDGAWTTAVGFVGVLYLSAAVSVGWALSPHAGIDAGRGAAWVAAHACRSEGRIVTPAGSQSALAQSVDSGPRSRLSGLVIEDASRRPPRDTGPVWAANDLPPGRYRVVLTSSPGATGTARIALGRPDATIAECQMRDQVPAATGCEIVLPAGAAALFIDADAQLRRTTERLALAVEALGPASDCRMRARRAAANGAGVLYLLDGASFVEPGGLWTAGGASVTLAASARGSGVVRLRVRHGAGAGLVTVRSGAWHAERQLAASESWDVDVPRRPQQHSTTPIEVTTTARFRPSDVDSSNGDHRLLGAWIELL